MICIGVLGVSLCSNLQIDDKQSRETLSTHVRFSFLPPRSFSREVTQIVKPVSSIIICSGQGVEGRKEKYVPDCNSLGTKSNEADNQETCLDILSSRPQQRIILYKLMAM